MLGRVVTQLMGDTQAGVSVAEIIVLTSILGIGAVAGLHAVRISVVQELGDIGVALERLDQSYSATIGGVVSRFQDTIVLNDSEGTPPGDMCIVNAISEN